MISCLSAFPRAATDACAARKTRLRWASVACQLGGAIDDPRHTGLDHNLSPPDWTGHAPLSKLH